MKLISTQKGNFAPRNPEYYQTVIIGAGMAGLGAASKLTELGYEQFVILEAQNQPGGRIKTVTVDGKPLDVGAQWLHGKDNPLYHIALKHGLLSNETSEEGLGVFIRNDGVVIDRFLVKQVDFQIGKILEECQSFLDKTEYPTSVGDYLRDKFLEYLSNCDDSEEVVQTKLELFDWHLRFQIIDNSCHSLQRLSAKYWGSYVCLDDIAHFNLKHGYQSLVDVIISDLPKNSVNLNTEVIRIDYDSNEYNNILLTCSNDKLIHCDHLIMTASVGVLRDFHNINPPLPRFIKDSINDIGFYGIAKIYLFFEEKWWKDTKGFQFLWRAGTAFDKGQEWVRHMTGFDEVFNQPNALVGWVGSDGVHQVEELSETEVGTVCIDVLRRFLQNYHVPEPKTVLRTRWFSNPWVKGSYCHITPECDHPPNSGINNLAEPVYVGNVPRIFLAGEAVHPSHYSTTHGAYESGQQQAATLHEFIMKQRGIFSRN